MDIYLRKSLRAGPFRFNLNRSGVGVSVGVPGFRIGTGPRGNYIHVGGAGVQYRATLGEGTTPSWPGATQSWTPPPAADVVMEDTTGATATDLVATGSDDLLDQINAASRRLPLWPFALLAVLIAVGQVPNVVGTALMLLSAPGVYWIWQRDRARRSVVVFYTVDDEPGRWFGELVDGFEPLSKANGLWRVNASGDVRTTMQFKRNAGASALIARARARASLAGPKALVANIAVPTISSGRHALHFLPDRMLVREGRNIAEISYDQLDVHYAPQRFIEDGRVPGDGQQVDTTWRFVNVKGGPDRRFNDNRQLPVMLYGRLEFETAQGLRWIVDCSRAPVAERMCELIRGGGRVLSSSSVASHSS